MVAQDYARSPSLKSHFICLLLNRPNHEADKGCSKPFTFSASSSGSARHPSSLSSKRRKEAQLSQDHERLHGRPETNITSDTPKRTMRRIPVPSGLHSHEEDGNGIQAANPMEPSETPVCAAA